jgi:hypothetical protein
MKGRKIVEKLNFYKNGGTVELVETHPCVSTRHLVHPPSQQTTIVAIFTISLTELSS